MRGVSGPVLAGEVERYRAANGMTQADFARASGVPAQTLSGLTGVSRAGSATVAKVRAYMEGGPLRPSPAASVAPVAVRPVAIRPVTMTEAVATAALATPSDLVRHVTVRWPEVWAAVVERARADDVVPGAALVAAIERGLGLEVTCG